MSKAESSRHPAARFVAPVRALWTGLWCAIALCAILELVSALR